MALSALARHMRKERMLKFGTGIAHRRTSAQLPAPKGMARGTLGSMGSSTIRNRNSDAGENQDRSEFGLPKLPSTLFRDIN